MKRFLPYVGPIIGLTGVILAFYFHGQSVQERVPTFYVSPQRAVIVDARGPTSSDLQVLYRRRLVQSSVTAVTLYLWNEGKLPVRASDILGEPVSVELDSPSEILEARLIKVSRPVIRFSTGEVSEKARNSLPVSFDILEQHDGAAIQLIYAGDPSSAVKVRGTIVGAGSPKPLSPGQIRFSTTSTPQESRRAFRFAGYVTIVMGLLAFVRGSTRLAKKLKAGLWGWRSTFTVALLLAVGVAYVAGGAFRSTVHTGPGPLESQ